MSLVLEEQEEGQLDPHLDWGKTCALCLQPYTNDHTDHRLVAIKCGHLFGRSCILRVFIDAGNVHEIECPNCRSITHHNHIRIVHTNIIRIQDVDFKERRQMIKRIDFWEQIIDMFANICKTVVNNIIAFVPLAPPGHPDTPILIYLLFWSVAAIFFYLMFRILDLFCFLFGYGLGLTIAAVFASFVIKSMMKFYSQKQEF